MNKAQMPRLDRRVAIRNLFGDEVEDPYSWIRFDHQAAVAHLKAENSHTDSVLKASEETQQAIFEQIKSRIKETDLSVPVEVDGWEYYSRTVAGQSYPIHCRRRKGGETEELVLDENLEAEGKDYFSLGAFEISPDHQFLLWGFDATGDEEITLLVRDLASGRDVETGITDSSGSTAWLMDSQYFYHVQSDKLHRPYRVVLVDRKNPKAGEVRFQENDDRFFVGVDREKDDSFIQITVSSKLSDEVYLLPSDAPGSPNLFAPRQSGFEYSVVHHEQSFYILTNRDGADNFKIMVTSDASPAIEHWQEFIAESDTVLNGIDVVSGHLLLAQRIEGFASVGIVSIATGETLEIPKPDSPSTLSLGANLEMASTKIRYSYQSLNTPPAVMEYDLISRRSQLLKQQELVGDFEPLRYKSELRFVETPQGGSVPISLIYQGDLDEAKPCVIYAYGAYEIPVDPAFSVSRLSLLDAGAVFAIAHVRGGGELGRRWYEGGKLENKVNTFKDLVLVTEHLLAEGVAAEGKVCIRGGSAGGLTVAAAANRRPDLFRSVVAEVPFVDVVNTMLDEDLPLTATEWEEWGNPKESESAYWRMAGYSPYENVQRCDYPDYLITTGINDPWVGFWEPVKFAQVLRDNTTSEVLVKAELDSGHGGPSGRYDLWRDEAFILAYIVRSLGLSLH